MADEPEVEVMVEPMLEGDPDQPAPVEMTEEEADEAEAAEEIEPEDEEEA